MLKWIWVPAILAALAIATVSADTGHFHSADASVGTDGVLTVSFDERGLGNADVDYLLTADGVAEWHCFNGGGNHPQAANKETIAFQVVESASFEPKNGRVVASISGPTPSPGDFECPPGQRLRFMGATYSNILLTDLTNDVSISP